MVTLIRYTNRKLYCSNKGLRRYLSSADVVTMLQAGTKVRIVTANTGIDVTNTSMLNMGAALARQGALSNAMLLIKYAEAYSETNS